jgi:transposase
MADINKLFGRKPTYNELLDIVSTLLEKVETLTLRVNELETELSFYKSPKNSNNSSVPPSQDQNRIKKNQSLREKSGKGSGGQNGHKGNTLMMIEVPDRTVVHIQDVCSHCGEDISGVEAVLIGKRQVVEIPPIKPVYIQHETFGRHCKCGTVCEGVFPEGIAAPVQYGDTVQNLVSYLSVRHFLPFRRTREAMNHVFNIPLCEGSIANFLQKTAERFYPSYIQIKGLVQASPAVGADETGAVINGQKAWIWIWQDLLNTFLDVSYSRGKDTVDGLFPDGFPDTVLVSDAWAAHLSTSAKGHQLCLAHLLRELNYFIELYPFNPWPKKLKSLFESAIHLKKHMTELDYANSPQRDRIAKSFKKLLKEVPPKESRFYPFYKRMLKHEQSVFGFLHHPDVPPDNNGSERGIRNVKVKQKVSGQFKNFDGAKAFVIIRSVIDTFIKRGFDIFESLANIPNFAPE